MTKLDVGPVSVTLSFGDWDALVGAAPEVEELGYSGIWISGGQLSDLGRVGEVVRATREIQVGTGIIPLYGFTPDVVAEAYGELEATHPGRFIVGLGGAHGPKPVQAMNDYLDRLDEANVPAGRRVLAALGPRMTELAGDRTAGALPFLVTPDFIAEQREILGEDSTLIAQLNVILETDPERARAAARVPLGFLRDVPGYRAQFKRLGFTEEDVARLSDPFVDALSIWGDVESVADEVSAYLAAGADQVALTVLRPEESDDAPVEQWRLLAGALSAVGARSNAAGA